MHVNSYTSELPNLVNNLFNQIEAIQDIKNSLKRSAEEFEAKQLIKKTNLVASTDWNNLNSATELPNLVNNSFNQIEAIQDIKNSLKRSAEEFEAKQLIKKTNLVASTDWNNLTSATELTNDISYIEEVKNSNSHTNEVSEIIDKEIEFLYGQKFSTKNDQFQKIIKELFPDELINNEIIVESQLSEPFVLSSNIDQETSLESPPSTDIISLAWTIAVLSSDNNLESEANESTISYDLTNDVSSSNPTREINQKISEPIKRSWKNPEYRKMRAEAIKRSWEDEEYRKKKKSEFMKRNWEDPEFRKKISEAKKRSWKNPEYRKKISEATKRTWEDPEYRKKISEATKRTWEDPEFRKKMSEAMERNWEKRSEAMKAKTQKTIQKVMEPFTTERFVVKKPTKTYQKLRNPSHT